MIVVISGTNRQGSNSLKVAKILEAQVKAKGQEVFLINLEEFPAVFWSPDVYANKPRLFEPFQEAIFKTKGIISVVPEYNGSYPGALKYFIDMLKFPESLVGVPAAFVGIGAGEWGGLRAVEQLEMVFQYRNAFLFNHRVFIKGIGKLLDAQGQIQDPQLMERLERMTREFVDYSLKMRP